MILISGEALIDLIPDPVKADAYDAVLGGSPYNVAIGLGRLGAPTAFVSRISADGNGEALAGVARRERGRSELRRARHAPDDARLRHARHRQDRLALFVLPRRDRLTTARGLFRPNGQEPARHLHVGSFAAVDARHGQSVVEAMTAARPHATVSFDPNIRPSRDPGSRGGRAARRTRKSRSRISSRRARKTSSGSIPTAASRRASPPGRSPARDFASRRWASAALSRCSARSGSRSRRRRSRSSTPSAPATASCRRFCRRWTATTRSAPRRPRHLEANSKGGSALRRPLLQSPARARARIRRRARKSRRRLRA